VSVVAESVAVEAIGRARQGSRRVPVGVEACVPAAVALVGAWLSLGLRVKDLQIPLSYRGDALFYLVETRMLGGSGSYLQTAHLGWPVGMQMYDYPQGGDNLHLGVLWALMRVTGNPFLSVNLYYLAGFALAALTAHVVLRRLGVGPMLAGSIAVVFALLPYHFSRGELHLFLSAYFLVPVGVGVAVAILESSDRDATRLVRSPWVLAGVAAIASAGLYYFAFSVLLFVGAAVGVAVTARRLRAAAPGVMLSAVGAGVFVLNHAPSLWYWAAHGTNGAALPDRGAAAGERCGLRITQLFLPQPNHHIPLLAHLTQQTMLGWPPDESGQQVGFLAAAGIAIAVGAVAVATLSRGGPRGDGRTSLGSRLEGLGYLAVVCLLTASVGGFSYVLSAGGLGLIRCWNRISVVLAFIGLIALAAVVERVLTTRSFRPFTTRVVTGAVAAVIVVVAVVDQTPARPPDHDAINRDVTSDRTFFAAVAARLPPHGTVFELPNVVFPEGLGPNGTGAYDPAKGYLYQPHLYWSFGAVRGRDDAGIARLAQTDPADLAVVLSRAGYQGLVIDRRALGDQAATVEAAILPSLGDPVTSSDGRYLFHRLPAQTVAKPGAPAPATKQTADANPTSSCPDSPD
jgi:phosphoglycerol transferase